jgi:hypothetical protein
MHSPGHGKLSGASMEIAELDAHSQGLTEDVCRRPRLNAAAQGARHRLAEQAEGCRDPHPPGEGSRLGRPPEHL